MICLRLGVVVASEAAHARATITEIYQLPNTETTPKHTICRPVPGVEIRGVVFVGPFRGSWMSSPDSTPLSGHRALRMGLHTDSQSIAALASNQDDHDSG